MKRQMLRRLLEIPTPGRLEDEIRHAQSDELTDEEREAIREYVADLRKAHVVSEKERARLRSLYPLFEWVFDDITGGGSYRVAGKSDGGVSFFVRAGFDLEHRADHDHMCASVESKLKALYPYLTFLVLPNRSGVSISTWAKHQEDKKYAPTAIGKRGLELGEVNLHLELALRNAEAKKAQQPDMFLCSGHDRAEPKADYDFFYFSGKYCRQFAAENPDVKKAAQAERYN